MKTRTATNLLRRKYLHIILPCFAGSVIDYLDRINISNAALTMNDLKMEIKKPAKSRLFSDMRIRLFLRWLDEGKGKKYA